MTNATPIYHATAKSDVWVMRQIGRVSPRFMTHYWTVWRWPMGVSVVYYPGEHEVDWSDATRQHEEHHVRQISPWYGPLLIMAYLVVPWVRWLCERRAYLINIDAGEMTPKQVADLLARDYWVMLPRKYMRGWLSRHAYRENF